MIWKFCSAVKTCFITYNSKSIFLLHKRLKTSCNISIIQVAVNIWIIYAAIGNKICETDFSFSHSTLIVDLDAYSALPRITFLGLTQLWVSWEGKFWVPLKVRQIFLGHFYKNTASLNFFVTNCHKIGKFWWRE